MQRRPEDFRLNLQHPLWKRCRFRGLGWQPGSAVLRDGCGQPGYARHHGALVDMDPDQDWKFSRYLGRWTLGPFDDSDDYVDCYDIGTGAYPVSMSCWWRYAQEDDNYDSLMSWGSSWNTSLSLMVHQSWQNTNGYATVKLNTCHTDAKSSGEYDYSLWHHAVGIWRSATSRSIYVDGALDVTNTDDDGTPTLTTNFEIGKRVGQTSWSNQQMADWLIWDRVLSDAEIRLLADPSETMLGGALLPIRRRGFIGYSGVGGGSIVPQAYLLMRA